MRKMLFTGVSLFLVNFCFAQSQFALTIGGGSEDWGNSIIQTSDGGFAVVGVTFSFGAGSSDIFFAKFDATGTLEWARAIGGASWDKGYSLIQTSDGGFAVIGATYSFGAGEEDLLLLKLTPSGSLEWAYSIGGTNDDWGNSIIQTPDGKYIVIGKTESFDSGIFLTKVTPTGSIEWSRLIGGTIDKHSFAIQTRDRGFAIVGYVESPNDNLFIAKIDSMGIVEWARSAGGTGEDKGHSIIQTSDDGFLVIGGYGYNSYTGTGGDLLLIKFSSTGSVEWTRTLGGREYDWGYSVVQMADGNFAVVGKTESFSSGHYTSSQLFFAKVDSTGTLNWAYKVEGECGYSIVQASDEGLIAVGERGNDLFIIKFDPEGNTCIGENISPTVTDVGLTITSSSPSCDSINPMITAVTPAVGNVIPTVTNICTDKIELKSIPQKFKITITPNPFNSSCIITVPQKARVKICDLEGRVLYTDFPISCDKKDSRAEKTFVWSPNNSVPSGIYLLQVTIANELITKRIILIR